MTAATSGDGRAPRLSGKLIQCVVPDDGTDKMLLRALRDQMGIVSGYSRSCRSVAALTKVKAKPGKLPPSELARLVQVVTSEDQADAVFDLLFETAKLDQPGRGVVWQGPLLACTAFALPEGVPEEAG